MKRPYLMEKLLSLPAYSDVLDVRLLAILKIITLMCCNLAILQTSTTVPNSYAVCSFFCCEECRGPKRHWTSLTFFELQVWNHVRVSTWWQVSFLGKLCLYLLCEKMYLVSKMFKYFNWKIKGQRCPLKTLKPLKPFNSTKYLWLYQNIVLEQHESE